MLTYEDILPLYDPADNEGKELREFSRGSHKKIVISCVDCGEKKRPAEAKSIFLGDSRRCRDCQTIATRKGCQVTASKKNPIIEHPRFSQIAALYEPRNNPGVNLLALTPGSDQKIVISCLSCGRNKKPSHVKSLFRVGEQLLCQDCAHDKVGNILSLPKSGQKTVEDVPFLLSEWDFHKNAIHPSSVTVNSNRKYWWICKKCSFGWEVSPGHRFAKNTGCPRCKESHGEKRIHQVLETLGVSFERYKKFPWLGRMHFDFFLPPRLVIEFQGEQHYRPVNFGGYSDKEALRRFDRQQQRDAQKRRLCEENNIQLIEIPYSSFDQIEEILRRELAPYLPEKEHKNVELYSPSTPG